MKLLKIMLVSVLAVCASHTWAEEASGVIEAVKQRVQQTIPKAGVNSVKETPVAGIFQVELSSGEVLHVTEDVEYFFSGDLFQAKGSGNFTNLTEKHRGSRRTKLLAGLKKEDMVVFPAEGEKKGEVFVFTDVDCGYCRKFHNQVPQLRKMGIEVNYLAWPRAGLNSPTADTMRAVWCAEDPQAAMTRAKNREGSIEQPADNCNPPIEAQFKLGRQLGVRGTPAVYLPDGRQVGGYVPAMKLAAEMGIR